MSEENYLYPKWPEKSANAPHDWRKYVSEEVRSIWAEFTFSQRISLAKCFEDIASLEEWE